MNKLFVLCAISALAMACGGGDKPADNPTTTNTTTTSPPADTAAPADSAAPASSAAPAADPPK
ncbi:MAG: hypothetical protein KIT84_28020 [Labilithrix sp.]|nr:hypothetical protein [Labilithrix sp.]MCW5814905.1 hypothetical protein [Labilithrix sp.]